MKRYGTEEFLDGAYCIDCACSCDAKIILDPVSDEPNNDSYFVFISYSYEKLHWWTRAKEAWKLFRGKYIHLEEMIVHEPSIKKFCKEFLKDH